VATIIVPLNARPCRKVNRDSESQT
jgi:hypothetical protein